jgi:3-oxoacyl-[acyl-carrier protein] reductase
MEQKSVIITGGSKGLGRGIAKVFAREGAKVLVVSRQPDTGERTAKEIVDAGGTASFFRADVSDSDDVAAMADAAMGG